MKSNYKLISFKYIIISILLFSFIFSTNAQQVQDYYIDTSFQVNFNGLSSQYTDFIGDFVVNDDGTIVAVGSFEHVFNMNLPRQCVKFNSDGSLNNGFHFPLNQLENGFGPNRILKHNQFYYISIINYAPGVIKLTEDGVIDTTFNIGYTNGLQYSHFSVLDLFVDSLGKVMIAGLFIKNGDYSTNLMRFNADGSLDTTFIRPHCNSLSTMILPLPDHKYLIGGFESDITLKRMGIWRIFNDGTLDTTFDSHCNWGLTGEGHIFPNGKILIGANMNIPGYGNGINLIRLNTNGSVDTTFKYIKDCSSTNLIEDYLLLGSKIVIGGHFSIIHNYNCHSIAALDTLGNIDSTFFGNSTGPDSATSVYTPSIYFFGKTSEGDIIASGPFTRFDGFKTFSMVKFKRLFVGIDDKPVVNDRIFEISPNPASILLNISFRQPEQGEIYINDITGRQLKDYRIPRQTQQYTLNINDLSPGVYFLCYRSIAFSKSYSTRFIVVR